MEKPNLSKSVKEGHNLRELWMEENMDVIEYEIDKTITELVKKLSPPIEDNRRIFMESNIKDYIQKKIKGNLSRTILREINR